jgi:hypothetical protein
VSSGATEYARPGGRARSLHIDLRDLGVGVDVDVDDVDGDERKVAISSK